MKTLRKTTLAIAGSTLGLMFVAGSVQATPVTRAFAAPDTGAHASRTVSYADLNLNTDKGMRTLRQRIEAAAAQVCGPTDIRRAGSLRASFDARQCREDAVESALGQVTAGKVASSQ